MIGAVLALAVLAVPALQAGAAGANSATSHAEFTGGPQKPRPVLMEYILNQTRGSAPKAK